MDLTHSSQFGCSRPGRGFVGFAEVLDDLKIRLDLHLHCIGVAEMKKAVQVLDALVIGNNLNNYEAPTTQSST